MILFFCGEGERGREGGGGWVTALKMAAGETENEVDHEMFFHFILSQLNQSFVFTVVPNISKNLSFSGTVASSFSPPSS